MNLGDNVLTAREIALHVKGLVPPTCAILRIHVEEHIGGSPYNQVYRVRPVNQDAAMAGLIPTATYCLKVYHVTSCRLCPRDTFFHMVSPRRRLLAHLDRIGRMGALWQLIIRRAATETLNDPDCVPKMYATFYDQNLRAFGTIEEWAPGRSWRVEADDAVFDRLHPPRDPHYREPSAFTSEYTAKRFFMARFARLLREMGADGLALRYDWNNLRSARRVVLRAGNVGPYHGLSAVDFEPAPGDPDKLRAFLRKHADLYADIQMAGEELLALIEAPPRLPGEFTPVMPRANSALSHLLWFWSQDQQPLSLLPKLRVALDRSIRCVKKTIRKAFDPEARSAWLMDQIKHGVTDGQVTEEEARQIGGQIENQDVQNGLQCFFAYLCTLPVTPLVVILTGIAHAAARQPGVLQTLGGILAWLALFAVLPLSPGSLLRGLYTAIYLRQTKQTARFRVALALSFWRYVGFLAFPLQMAREFPVLSRFAASMWVARIVRRIPYYGKPGGLLEHHLFDLLYNLPLSLARLYREREKAGN